MDAPDCPWFEEHKVVDFGRVKSSNGHSDQPSSFWLLLSVVAHRNLRQPAISDRPSQIGYRRWAMPLGLIINLGLHHGFSTRYFGMKRFRKPEQGAGQRWRAFEVVGIGRDVFLTIPDRKVFMSGVQACVIENGQKCK